MTAMIYPTTNPAAAEQMMVARGEGPYIFDQQGKHIRLITFGRAGFSLEDLFKTL